MGAKHSSQIMPANEAPAKKFILGIIDVQNDFCTGGPLAVSEAEHAIAAINKLRYIYDEHIQTFITQDWHNAKHMSFAETFKLEPFTGPHKHRLLMEDDTNVDVEQMAWPRHCVENTYGAQLHRDLVVIKQDKFIKKGTKKNVESYSGFGDADKGKYEKTELYNWLQLLQITDIILTGLATDYCVYYTALDALRLGFNVHLIMDCTRGVAKDTTDEAVKDMKEKGVIFYNSVDEFHQTNKQIIFDNSYTNYIPYLNRK